MIGPADGRIQLLLGELAFRGSHRHVSCLFFGTQLKAELGADLAKLLNRLDARGALHHLLLGSRHSSSPFLFRPSFLDDACR